MNQDIATIGIEVDTRDLSRADRQLDKLTGTSRKTEKATDSLRRANEKLNRGMRVMAIAATATAVAMGALLKHFVSAASTAENYRVRLQYLLGSTEEGSRLFKEMAEYASRVPFEYKNIMESATALSGVMKGGVDEIKKWMPMIGDLAAVSGLSIEQTTSQVIRMYSAGAASADMFRERGILAMLGFTAGVKYSVEDTRKMMMESWTKAGSQFHGATAGLAETWDGIMSMFNDAWFSFRTSVMEAGVFDYMKAGLKEVLDLLKRVQTDTETKKWVQDLATSVVNEMEKIIWWGAAVSDSFSGWRLIFLEIKRLWLEYVAIPMWKVFESVRTEITNTLQWLQKLDQSWWGGWLVDTEAINGALADSNKTLEEQRQVLGWLESDLENTAARMAEIGDGLNRAKVEEILIKLRLRLAEIGKEAAAVKKVLSPVAEEFTKKQISIWEKYNKDYQILLIGEEEFKRQQYIKGLDLYLRIEQEKTGATAEEMAKRRALILEDYDKSGDDIDNLADTGKTAMETLTDAVNNFGAQSSQVITDFALHGKASFSDMIDSMIEDLVRMMIQEQIMGPLFKGISGVLFGSATGNAFEGGNVIPFASGGVVTRPTVFPMAQGAGLMGEAGPEAILPLKRVASGNLGVEASGGGMQMQVTIYNSTGDSVETKQGKTADGSPTLDVMIDQAVAKKLGTFGSKSNKAMRQNFGASQRLTRR